MYVHRALLLMLLVMYIFAPSIQAWITDSVNAWYRPHLSWLMVIAFVFWVQWRNKKT